MALKAEVLDALLAAGATAEMIVAAVKADMRETEEARERKRESNAERQRRFKARKRGYGRGNAGNALPDVTPPIEEIIPPVSSDEETTPPTKKPRQDQPVAKPEGVQDQTWQDFLKVRAKKRAPMTKTALAGIEAEAQKAGWPLEAAFAKCAVKGWQSFEAEWVSNTKPPGGGGDDLAARILKRQAAESTA